MKKVFQCLFVLFINIQFVSAQCEPDNCVEKINDGYTFLKTYNIIVLDDHHVEHSYVFSKDTNYMLILCDEGGSKEPDNLIVTVYDANRKEIATNYDKKNNKVYHAMAYNCKATGMYYLRFEFKEKKPECYISVLSFKK